ncbi:unnamed protein product [Rhizoctonia solani]|uniref:Uncharacterized protein n=1 Tax=Rhizoctonia solani TaxID=456999 RepID=A0A8H2XJV5_9AGAM|nr:unnamed protein product [Rhizoctonia solani]
MLQALSNIAVCVIVQSSVAPTLDTVSCTQCHSLVAHCRTNSQLNWVQLDRLIGHRLLDDNPPRNKARLESPDLIVFFKRWKNVSTHATNPIFLPHIPYTDQHSLMANAHIQKLWRSLQIIINQLGVIADAQWNISGRSTNSNVHHLYGRLYPLPLPDGGHPDGFPDTLEDFMGLNREQLNQLIQQYELLDDEQPRTNAERRAVLGSYWGPHTVLPVGLAGARACWYFAVADLVEG